METESVITPSGRHIYKDKDGYVWIDSTAFITADRKPCFWCGRMTNRLDVSYESHFCDSDTCNNEITAELIRVSNLEPSNIYEYNPEVSDEAADPKG